MTHDNAAALLSAAMDRTGTSNEALARTLGVRPSMVSMMRTGRMDIPACRAREICAALPVGLAALADACARSYPGNRTWRAYALGREVSAAA